MKLLKRGFLFLLLICCVFVQNTYCQFVCGDTVSHPGRSFSSNFSGLTKPLRTDISGNSSNPNGYIKMLIVFVQYKDDADSPVWPTNGAPIYLDSLISPSFNNPTNWWEAYNPNTQLVSDYWMNVSKGKLNIIGNAYSVVLSGEASKYSSIEDINAEIWENLKAQGLTDWSSYDQWKDTTIAGETKYVNRGDGYVDMIYKIHKNATGPMWNVGGYAQLALSNTDVEVDSTRHVKINYGYGYKGSGVTMSYCADKFINMGSVFHEHGHLLYAGGHITYGKVAYGAGFDGFFSPYESIVMNYMHTTDVDFAHGETHVLKDYSSHDTTTGNILKVPIQGDEFFLLANRGNVSVWDKVMMGDTATISGPFAYTGNYGKGLYIYHVHNGIHLPNGDENVQDEECADGLYNWTSGGTAHRYAHDKGYCYDAGNWTYYNKTSVSYDNDEGRGNSSVGDELSLGYGGQLYSWAGVGKLNTIPCLNNTDREFTTSTSIISMDKYAGDRYDPWNVGYNEVFSPYSSPSTKQWNNEESGIFIYLKNTNNSAHVDTLKIYSTSQTSEEDILAATPPSRPMGLTVEDDEPSGRLLLRWHHNMEPDMLRDEGKHRKYNIYKAVAGGDTVPTNYVFLTSAIIDDSADPIFIDTTAKATCCIPDVGCVGGPCVETYQVRYEITAVDVTEWESVRSDFQGSIAWKWVPGHEGQGGDEHGDLTHAGSNLPTEYKLYQNYPNPFNPTTNIVYDLPKEGFVTIKIYDVLGREIKTLVQEFKQAGSYLIPFEGAAYSSGVYFYRVETNNFIQTKRMILMK